MNVASAVAFVRKNGARAILEIAFNFVLPYVVYVATKQRLGDVNALIASSVPPVLWSIAEFARDRRIDALSILVLAGIVLSLLAFVGGGSAKFLQFRENFATVLIGLAFLISAAVGRPLIYELARAGQRRKSEADAKSFEALGVNANFKRSMTMMTLVWGFGLIAQAAVACALLFVLSIEKYLLVSPIVGYAGMGALALWTFWYASRRKRMRREHASDIVGEDVRHTG